MTLLNGYAYTLPGLFDMEAKSGGKRKQAKEDALYH